MRLTHPNNCHPDRSGPIFSLAPVFGASGRAVEGSRHNHFVLALNSLLEFRFSSVAFRTSLPDRWSLISDIASPQQHP
jgi:hypothetical protein